MSAESEAPVISKNVAVVGANSASEDTRKGVVESRMFRDIHL